MGVLPTSRLQILLTAASMVACIDSIVAGVAAALAVSGLAGASVPVVAAIGVAVALVLAAAFLLHQERRLYRAMAEVPGLFEWGDSGMPDWARAMSGRATKDLRVAGQGLVYEEPKAERSRRTLALPTQLVDALRAHRAAQLEERITAGSLWEDNDLVFAQANGRPIERKSDWQAWKALLHEADVRDVRLHDGRHTAATLLLSEGVHPRVVMEVLGHAQMRTTTDTYSPVMPALGRDAADRMGIDRRRPQPQPPDERGFPN
jgi:hypothetical protein